MFSEQHTLQFQGWLSQSLAGSEMGHMAGGGQGRLRRLAMPAVRGNGCCASDDLLQSRDIVKRGLEPDTLGFKSTSFYLQGLKQVT